MLLYNSVTSQVLELLEDLFLGLGYAWISPGLFTTFYFQEPFSIIIMDQCDVLWIINIINVSPNNILKENKKTNIAWG